MVVCYLGIGSNLGNRQKYIESAVKKIRALKDTKIIRKSKILESIPLGGPLGQRNYLNGALKIKTGLSVNNLHKNLLKIEHDLGRIRRVRFGPRVIDLDILLYGDRRIRTKSLTVPHKGMFKRDFVIKPLMEIL